MLGADGEPVDLVGYGPISPDIADDLLAQALHPTIRRLLVDPVDGTLVVREPAPPPLRRPHRRPHPQPATADAANPAAT